MNSKAIFHRVAWTRNTGAATLLCLLVAVVGCAGSGAYFQRSYDVAREFERGTILTDHRYYVGGPEAKPNAIAAVHTDYTLDSEHWREVSALTPEGLSDLVKRIRQVSGAEYKEKTDSNGARIIAPDGRVIGIWYSVYERSQVRYLADNRVYLSFPPAYLPTDTRIPIWEGAERHP